MQQYVAEIWHYKVSFNDADFEYDDKVTCSSARCAGCHYQDKDLFDLSQSVTFICTKE